MFAKLSNTYSRLTDLRWNVVSESRDEVIPMSSQDNLLPPDVQVLSQLSLAVPGIAMEAMAGVCGKVFSPLCHYAHASLSADVENIVLSLHEADSSFVYRDTYPNDEVDDIYAIPFPLGRIREATEMSSRCPPKTCSDRDEYIASLLQFSTIPSIVITPAPSQSRGMSCVPVQDTYFGARLTVPSYSALNAAHPPMMAPSYLHTPVHTFVRVWMYRHGHWCAVAPRLDEQERRGLFSRSISIRRRAMRKKSGFIRDVPFSCKNMFKRNKRDL